MILLVRILLINIELMMMNGKIKQGLSSSSKRNCKYLMKLLTVLDFPEAKVECFSRFVILPANRQEIQEVKSSGFLQMMCFPNSQTSLHTSKSMVAFQARSR